MNKLNVGCGPFYADGWVNVDVHENEDIHPDLVVDSNKPYPFSDNYFNAVYMGHVLEHLPWDSVESFLNEMSRISSPDAIFMIVGPDMLRVLEMWKKDEMSTHEVIIALEHQDANYQNDKDEIEWDGAPHYWNCHESRVEKLLNKMGFREVTNEHGSLIVNQEHIKNIDWPVVSHVQWQLAISFKNKEK